jgi:predicted PurR-regulated permease PerM
VRALTGVSNESVLSRATRSIEALEGAIKQEMTPRRPAEGQGQSPVVLVKPSDVSAGTLDRVAHLVTPLAQAGLTLLFVLFLQLEQQDIRDRVVRVLGTDNMTEVPPLLTGDGGTPPGKAGRLSLVEA